MSLINHLRIRIEANGPLTIADYMTECLLHPTHGYYTTRDPLGAAGDFTTAPEVSQMFGELIGLALAQNWLDQGAPGAFTLAELGPGRGTLMADILRATRGVPGFHAAANLVLVEASPTLRNVQRGVLKGHPTTWADSVTILQDAPLWLVANEFFDALPIRQFQRDNGVWRERQVGWRGDGLVIGLGGPATPPGLGDRTAEDGTIVELRPMADGIMAEVAARIERHGGAALVIDYGDWQSRGDTFQAMKHHAFADPLAEPGTADLTAHVDFGALVNAAPALTPSQMTPQGVFLERLGITARAQTLAAKLTGDPLTQHLAAHRRLTHPEEMGTLFKTIALVPKGAAMLAGLET